MGITGSREIIPIREIGATDYDCIVITSYLKRNELYKVLLTNKMENESVKIIFPMSG